MDGTCFPIRFGADIEHPELKLEVPDALVTFKVENGTWEDGTTEEKDVSIPMDVIPTNQGALAVGTLTEADVPAGMKAAEGYDQNSGKWKPELILDKNGVILAPKGEVSASYTYVFENNQPAEPENPTPGKPSTTPTKPAGTSKPQTTKPASKPSKTNTALISGASAFTAAFVAAGAGLVALMKKRK